MATGARVVNLVQQSRSALIHIPDWVLYGMAILIGVEVVFGMMFSWVLATRIVHWFKRGGYKR